MMKLSPSRQVKRCRHSPRDAYVSLQNTTQNSAELLNIFGRLKNSVLFWQSIRLLSVLAIQLAAVFLVASILNTCFLIPVLINQLLLSSAAIWSVFSVVNFYRREIRTTDFSRIASQVKAAKPIERSKIRAIAMLLDDLKRSGKLNQSNDLVLKQAKEMVAGWNWHQSVDRKEPLRFVLIAIVLGCLSWFALSSNLIFKTWIGSAIRDGFLSEVNRSPRLEFIDPPSMVIINQPLRLQVKSKAQSIEEIVTLEFSDPSLNYQSENETQSEYSSFLIGSASQSFQVRAVSTHSRPSEWLLIPAIQKVEAIEHEFRYSMEVQDSRSLTAKPIRSRARSIAISKGAKVKLWVRFSAPIFAAKIQALSSNVFSDDVPELTLLSSPDDELELELDLSELANSQSRKTTFVADTMKPDRITTEIAIYIQDAFKNTYRVAYPLQIEFLIDTPPIVRLSGPVNSATATATASASASASASIDMRGFAEDDRALKSVTGFVEFVGDFDQPSSNGVESATPIDLMPFNVNASIDSQRSFEFAKTISIRPFLTSQQPNAELLWWVEAIDSADQRTKSKPIRIELSETIQDIAHLDQLTEQIGSAFEHSASIQREASELSQRAQAIADAERQNPSSPSGQTGEISRMLELQSNIDTLLQGDENSLKLQVSNAIQFAKTTGLNNEKTVQILEQIDREFENSIPNQLAKIKQAAERASRSNKIGFGNDKSPLFEAWQQLINGQNALRAELESFVNLLQSEQRSATEMTAASQTLRLQNEVKRTTEALIQKQSLDGPSLRSVASDQRQVGERWKSSEALHKAEGGNRIGLDKVIAPLIDESESHLKSGALDQSLNSQREIIRRLEQRIQEINESNRSDNELSPNQELRNAEMALNTSRIEELKHWQQLQSSVTQQLLNVSNSEVSLEKGYAISRKVESNLVEEIQRSIQSRAENDFSLWSLQQIVKTASELIAKMDRKIAVASLLPDAQMVESYLVALLEVENVLANKSSAVSNEELIEPKDTESDFEDKFSLSELQLLHRLQQVIRDQTMTLAESSGPQNEIRMPDQTFSDAQTLQKYQTSLAERIDTILAKLQRGQ